MTLALPKGKNLLNRIQEATGLSPIVDNTTRQLLSLINDAGDVSDIPNLQRLLDKVKKLTKTNNILIDKNWDIQKGIMEAGTHKHCKEDSTLRPLFAIPTTTPTTTHVMNQGQKSHYPDSATVDAHINKILKKLGKKEELSREPTIDDIDDVLQLSPVQQYFSTWSDSATTEYRDAMNAIKTWLNTQYGLVAPARIDELAGYCMHCARLRLGSVVNDAIHNDSVASNIKIKGIPYFTSNYGSGRDDPAIHADHLRRRYWGITTSTLTGYSQTIVDQGLGKTALAKIQNELKDAIEKKIAALEIGSRMPSSITLPAIALCGGAIDVTAQTLTVLGSNPSWKIRGSFSSLPISIGGHTVGIVQKTGTDGLEIVMDDEMTLHSKGIDPHALPTPTFSFKLPIKTTDGSNIKKDLEIRLPLTKPKNNAAAEYAKLETNINSCLDRVSQSLWTDAIRKLYAGNPKFTSLNDDQQKTFLEHIEKMAGGTTTINGQITPDTTHLVFGPLATGTETVATSFRGLRKKLKDERKNLYGQDSHTPWTDVLKTMKRSLGLAETDSFDPSKIDPSKISLDASLFADGLNTQLANSAVPGELDNIITRFRDEEIAAKTPWYDDTENKKIYGQVFVSQYEQAQKEAFYTFLKSQKRTIGRKQTTVYDYLVEQARLKNSKGKGYKDTAYLDDLFYRTIGHSTIDDTTGSRTITMRTGGVALPSTVIGTHIPPVGSVNVIDDSHAMLKNMLINKFLDKKDQSSFDQAIKDFFANGDNIKKRLGGEVEKTYPGLSGSLNSNVDAYLTHVRGNITYDPTGSNNHTNPLIHKTRDADDKIQDRRLDIAVINGLDIIRDELVAKLEKEAGNINIESSTILKYINKVGDRLTSLRSSEKVDRVKAKRIARRLLKKNILLHGGTKKKAQNLLKKCGLTEIDRRDLFNKIEEAGERAKYEERIAQAMPPEIAFSAIRKEEIGLNANTREKVHALFSQYVLGSRTSTSWIKAGRTLSGTSPSPDTERLEMQAKLAHILEKDLKHNVRDRYGYKDTTLIAGNLMKLFDAKKEEIQLLRAIKDGDIKDGADLKAKMESYRRVHGVYPQTLVDAATSKAGVFEWSDEFFEQAKIQAQELLHDRSPTKAKHILNVNNITVTVYNNVAPAGESLRNKATRLAANSLDIWLARNPKRGLLGYAAIKSLIMGILGLLGVTGGIAGAVIPAAVFTGIYAGFKQKGMKKEELGEVMRLIQQLKDPSQRGEILDKHGLGDTDLGEFMYETDQVAAKLHEFAYKDGFDDADDATDALKEIGNFMAGHAISQLHGIRMFGGISEANYGRCMKDTYAIAEKYRRRRNRLSAAEKNNPEIVPIAISGTTKDQQINAILRESCGKVFKELEGQAKLDHAEKFAPVNKMINRSARTRGAIAGVLGAIIGGVGYGIAQAFTDTGVPGVSTGGSSSSGSTTVIPGTPSTTINQTATDLAKYFGNDVPKAEQFIDLVNNKKMLLSEARKQLGVTDIKTQNGILITLQESYGLNFDKNLAGLTSSNAPEYRARLQAYGYGPILSQLNINDSASLWSFLNGGYPSGSSDMIKGCWLQLAAHFDPDAQPHTFNVISKVIPGTPDTIIPGTGGVGGGVSDASIPGGPAGSYSGMRHVFFKDRLENHLADPNSNDLGDLWTRLKSEVSDIFGRGTLHDKIADDFLTRVMDGQTMNQAINDLGLPGAKYDELILKIGQDSDWVRSVLDQRMFMDGSGKPTLFATEVYNKILASHPNILAGPNGIYSVDDMKILIQQYMAGQQVSNLAVQKLMGAIMDHSYGGRGEIVQHILDYPQTWKRLNMIPHVNMADAVKNSIGTGLGVFVGGASTNIYDEVTKRTGPQGEQSSISNPA